MIANTWRRLVAFGFRLLYNELAWTYDLVSWLVSLGRWRAWQRASLNFVQGPRVLEIAHGPGHMLVELRRRGYEVSGCDLSPVMGGLARARLRRAGMWGEVALFRCRLPALPLGEAHFDSILSQFPTPFITQVATLAALYTRLRPGGALVILPEGHLTGRGPLYRLITWLFVITGQSSGGDGADGAAVRDLWAAWRERLEATGFVVTVDVETLDGSACTIIVARRPAV